MVISLELIKRNLYNEFMNKDLGSFLRSHTAIFFEALFNLYLFFPYLFSVGTLFKTLFAPWKGLVDHSKQRGFSFNSLFERFMFNAISSGIGFTMRFTLLLFFLIFQTAYIVSLPVVILLYLILSPVFYLLFLITPTDDQKKQEAKQRFLSSHMLKPENQSTVEAWFEKEYQERMYALAWWKLDNLFHITPIAKDWAAGYTPMLDEYSIELTGSSYQTNMQRMVGRNKEIAEIERALLKAEEANVLIVGEDGVGKHTIVDAFAKKIYTGSCNPLLAYKRILKLEMEKILSKFNNTDEDLTFFKGLLEEAARSKNVILFIDNLDKYITSGAQDRVDLTAVLEEYGRTNRLQIMGLTTPFAYDKYIFFNEKIKLLFTKVDVYEIAQAEAMQILMQDNRFMEQRYKVVIPYETLQTVIEKSDFFITSIPFPEKALQLLDNVCVYTNQVLKQKVVLPANVDKVLMEKTHSPTTLTEEMKQKLLTLEQDLQNTVINQAEATHELAAAMRRSFLLLGKRKKPLSSFLFLGPTGVGKTETAKAIAVTFFGGEKAMMRFDMSLYQTTNDIPKLIGSVETQDPGILTTAVREQPYGVLLLDEIEKADKNLLNIFLTILDEGYFSDGFGKRVDCKNLVIIATSNAGAEFIYEHLKAGTTAIQPNELIAYLIEKRYYTPEFLNRFDGVIAFNPIQSNSMVPIARKMLATIEKQIFDLYKVKLEVSDATLEAVLSKNADPAFGARNLDRILRNEIEDQVAQLLLANKVQPGSTIKM